MVAAGLGAALVTAAVVVGRRVGRRRTPAGPRSAAARAAPAPAASGAGRPGVERPQVRARVPVRTAARGDGERPELPRRLADGEVPAGAASVAPAAGSGGAAAPGLPLDLLSELHEKFRADVERDVAGSASAPAPTIDRASVTLPADATGTPASVPAASSAPPADAGPADAGSSPGQGAAPLASGAAAPDPALDSRAHRGRRAAAAVAATAVFVALLAGLFVLLSGDDGGDTADAGDDPSAETGAGSTATTLGLPATPQEAFTRASQRLQQAGSFSYTGVARSTDVNPARPGLWLATDVVITGQVDLVAGRVHETAVVPQQVAGETVTDGPRAWGRSAPTTGELAAQPYQPIAEVAAPPGGRLGAALVPAWLGFATNAQEAGLDGQGRPTYRAMVPPGALGEVESGQGAPGAVVTLTLDPSGEPARVQVTAPPDGAALDIVLDIAAIGAPVTITPPAG